MTNKELKEMVKKTNDYTVSFLKSRRNNNFLTDSAIQSVVNDYNHIFDLILETKELQSYQESLFTKIKKHATKLLKILRGNAGRKTEDPKISTR